MPIAINKKPEKQNVSSAFEFQVPRQSREAAHKILEHLEKVRSFSKKNSVGRLNLNAGLQISSGSLQPLDLTFKGPSSSELSENLTPMSSSNGLATPALGVSSCNICLGPGGASSGVTNAAESIVVSTKVDTTLHVLDSPLVREKVKGFRMSLSEVDTVLHALDSPLVPEKMKRFRMSLSDESDDEDRVSNNVTRDSAVHCLDVSSSKVGI